MDRPLFSAAPCCAGYVRPPQRARRLWRRLRGHPHRRGQPRAGRAGADRAAQPRAPRRHRLRARLRRRRRHPAPGPRRLPRARSPASSCPRPARYAVGIAFLPARRRRPRPSARSRRSPPRRASTVLGWREVPVAPELLGADRPRHHARLPPALRRATGESARASTSTARRSCCASAPSARPASTSRRCPPAPSSTRAC